MGDGDNGTRGTDISLLLHSRATLFLLDDNFTSIDDIEAFGSGLRTL